MRGNPNTISDGAPLSDFYAPRRSTITDLGALIGMGLGALGASLTMWPLLATGFRTGEMEKGFGLFLAAFMGAALASGVVGLGVGRLAGAVWERRHRKHRPPNQEATPASPISVRQAPITVGTLTVRALSVEAQRAVAIVQASAEPNGQPWGVWDGPRLVGVVWIVGEGADAVTTAAAASSGYDAGRLTAAALAAAVGG